MVKRVRKSELFILNYEDFFLFKFWNCNNANFISNSDNSKKLEKFHFDRPFIQKISPEYNDNDIILNNKHLYECAILKKKIWFYLLIIIKETN